MNTQSEMFRLSVNNVLRLLWREENNSCPRGFKHVIMLTFFFFFSRCLEGNPAQWSSGRVSALGLKDRGIIPWLSHTKDVKNGTHRPIVIGWTWGD